MSCTVVSDPAAAEGLRPAWTSLAERCQRNELSQSPDWLLTWWQVFGKLQGRQLRLGLFHDQGRLVGLVPLLRRRHWCGGVLPYRRLEFLASGERPEDGIYTNHLAVLAERHSEGPVIERLVASLVEGAFGTWDEVVLPMMSGDTAMPGLLTDACARAGLLVELRETASAPYLSLPTSWDAYLEGLSTSARRYVVRSLKAFDAWAHGSTRVVSVAGPLDLDKGKKILIRLHQGRWSSAGQAGVFRSPLHLQFHNAIMDHLVERGLLSLHWLCAHDEPVAVFYGMQWAGKVYAYQLGRRTDIPSRLRPGVVLLALAIRRAIEAGHREFDLLADAAHYKSRLAPQSRPLVRLRVARRSLREGLRRAAKGCLGALVRLRPSQSGSSR